ncbi:disA bacterial checkpoint controller nucleotide-binding protein [Clostridium sp. CAG:590]|nr:disA bacterial checkpoint controller nucleotide-binding protein [Clostridium sp. CAG:590]
MKQLVTYFKTYFDWFYIPRITVTDVIEIVIIAILIYYIMDWFKKTRAWTLIKGILVLLLFTGIAMLFQFNTILWIFKNTISVGVIAVIIIFQPEFRRALEQLGRKNFIFSLFSTDDTKSGRMIDRKVLNEIAKAVFAMAEVKTGALIVIEQDVKLGDYERTGIAIDAEVTSQLLINIFEHNTPLHDGAVLIRDNRIVSATCYLPLSDNLDINKSLGTRHRAGIGVSEVSDSITVIVSEETGGVSLAYNGMLYRGLTRDNFPAKIEELSKNEPITKKMRWWKGLGKHEKSNS